MLPTLSFTAFLLAATALEMLATRGRNIRTWLAPKVLIARFAVLALVYGFWFGLFWRPFTAAFFALATIAVFAGASRAKEALLEEPLVFLDLQFIGQILRHPRLYYSQLLLRPLNALAAIGILCGAAVLLSALPGTEQAAGHSPPMVARLVLLAGPFLLWALPANPLLAETIQSLLPEQAAELSPRTAAARWGIFVPMLAHYSRWKTEKWDPSATDPLPQPEVGPTTRMPHVLAVQCESFVDPRRFFRNAPDLPAFRQARASAAACGELEVPCGGAYTMRTEFSFLTGIKPEDLGCDRFNPYARAGRRDYPSLAKTLRSAGYSTHFVHPHDLRFFGRDAVMPALGFECLHGAEQFATAPRCGPYVSDADLGRYVADLFREAGGPRFVFAVTMENHGPWLDGRLPGHAAGRDAYLAHLANSDRLLGALAQLGADLDRPLILCFYGDHAPILASDLPHVTTPRTDYLVVSNPPLPSRASEPTTVRADQLPRLLLSLLADPEKAAKSSCTLTPATAIR